MNVELNRSQIKMECNNIQVQYQQLELLLFESSSSSSHHFVTVGAIVHKVPVPLLKEGHQAAAAPQTLKKIKH